MNIDPFLTNRAPDVAPIPFDAFVESADLIVCGSLVRIGTYLSNDERELYTDYEVLADDVISSRREQLAALQGHRPLVVRQWGGELNLHGVDVKITDENFPPMPTGVRLLLLMSYEPETGKYTITGKFGGVFAIRRGGELVHLVRPRVAFYELLNGAQVSRVLAEMRRRGVSLSTASRTHR